MPPAPKKTNPQTDKPPAQELPAWPCPSSLTAAMFEDDDEALLDELSREGFGDRRHIPLFRGIAAAWQKYAPLADQAAELEQERQRKARFHETLRRNGPATRGQFGDHAEAVEEALLEAGRAANAAAFAEMAGAYVAWIEQQMSDTPCKILGRVPPELCPWVSPDPHRWHSWLDQASNQPPSPPAIRPTAAPVNAKR